MSALLLARTEYSQACQQLGDLDVLIRHHAAHLATLREKRASLRQLADIAHARCQALAQDPAARGPSPSLAEALRALGFEMVAPEASAPASPPAPEAMSPDDVSKLHAEVFTPPPPELARKDGAA